MVLQHVAEAPSANEYIVHHLGFLSNKEAQGIVDFSVIHWDSVFFAVVLASAFYEYLGRHPVPAEALLAARLEKLGGPTHNPLGLLYTGLGRLV